MPEIRTEIEIDAPSARCWEVLSDLARFAEWNPAVERIDGRAALEERITLTLRAGRRRVTARARIDVFEPGVEIQWRGGASKLPWLVDVAHYFRLEPLGERTRLVHGERFSGVLPWLAWPMLGRVLRPRYPVVNAAFRERCEQRSS